MVLCIVQEGQLGSLIIFKNCLESKVYGSIISPRFEVLRELLSRIKSTAWSTTLFHVIMFQLW